MRRTLMYLMTREYFKYKELKYWRRTVLKSKDLTLSFIRELKKDRRFSDSQKRAILYCFKHNLRQEQINLIANPNIYPDEMECMCYGFAHGINMRQMRYILKEIILNKSFTNLSTIMDMAASGASYSELKREVARQVANLCYYKK